MIPGETLQIVVGGGGKSGREAQSVNGGYGGWGFGVSQPGCVAGNGGGGGRSSIQRSGNDVVTAGGGGGGGISSSSNSYLNGGGGGGGLYGLPLNVTSTSGSGGNQISGGSSPNSCGQNGYLYTGGTATCTCAAGGTILIRSATN